MKRLICSVAVLLALCVPARADDGLSMDEATDIILAHHGVETEIDVSGYLTMHAYTMTREAAVTAVVRSYGVYPADEPDYVWADEEEQDETYKPYIDYARRMGITLGVGGNSFAPGRLVTEWELRTMLDRAGCIEPEYELSYDLPIYKLLSAETQRGLSLIPNFLMDRFYKEDRGIHAAGNPIIMPNGSHLSDQYAGWIQYHGDIWLSVEADNEPYWYQYRTAIHEIGHFLGYHTAILDRNSVPDERDWLIHRYRRYCDESNHEFFADSFVAYILWPEELAANAPTVYRHIETCLHEMKSDLEETNYE